MMIPYTNEKESIFIFITSQNKHQTQGILKETKNLYVEMSQRSIEMLFKFRSCTSTKKKGVKAAVGMMNGQDLTPMGSLTATGGINTFVD